MSKTGGIETALNLIKNLPRVSLSNLKGHPAEYRDKAFRKRTRQGQHGGRKVGRGNKGQGQRNTLNPIGYGGGGVPFYLAMPKEPYYKNFKNRRQYPPVSLLQIQRMVDLGRVDPDEPIDLTALCNAKVFKIDPSLGHYGVNLTDEGADNFAAKLNLEVQWANEVSIAAVERNGGTICTRFFDINCVKAMVNPLLFFSKGTPIPRCKLPPQDALEYYQDPKNRGYLADPEGVAKARLELAQKYGYVLPDITQDEKYEMLSRRKSPIHIWYGLDPGWVVNLHDKSVLKPTDKELQEYYNASV